MNPCTEPERALQNQGADMIEYAVTLGVASGVDTSTKFEGLKTWAHYEMCGGGYTKVLDVGITKAEKPRKHADWTEEATVADQQTTNTKTTCGWQYHSRVCGLQSQNAHTARQT